MQFENEIQLRNFLTFLGAEVLNIALDDGIYHGIVCFTDFITAFQILSFNFDKITFKHLWYTDWSNSKPDEIAVGDDFLEYMFNTLNDDCICEVLKYMNPFQLQYIKQRLLGLVGQNNDRMSNIFDHMIYSKICRVNIDENTFGVIGIMNLKYLLYMYGDQIEELCISITTFPRTFGNYNSDLKYEILFLIASDIRNLKKLKLVGFNLDNNLASNLAPNLATNIYDADDDLIANLNKTIEVLKIKGVQIEQIELENTKWRFFPEFPLQFL